MNYLLGVDIGTYSSKGVLVTEEGRVVASKTVPHDLAMPAAGHVEHHPETDWWGDFCTIVEALLNNSGVKPGDIAGIGISTISPAVVPIDAEGRALRPAILYGIDTRTGEEIRLLEEALGREALAQKGIQLSSQSAAPKVMWIRRHEPDVWAQTEEIVNGSGYLVKRLTGKATLDVYDACIFAPFFDLESLQWSKEMADLLAPVEMMPEVTWTSDVAGTVTEKAARETGLSTGTPVITGTADAAAEAISAGLTEVGEMMVMYGSSIFFIIRTAELVKPPHFWASHFLEPNTSVVAGGMSTAGSLTRWFRDEFAQREMAAEAEGGENAYAALAELATQSSPGANGLVSLPYFAGERTPLNDPQAKGMIFGLTLSHTRADVYRAILESVGYGIRHNLEQMQAAGLEARRTLAVGGGTLNAQWMQMVSDILNIEQHIPEEQIGASYGDAFLAGIGAGLFNSTEEVERWVKIKHVVRPRPDVHDFYEPYYRLFRDLYEDNREKMARIGQLRWEP